MRGMLKYEVRESMLCRSQSILNKNFDNISFCQKKFVGGGCCVSSVLNNLFTLNFSFLIYVSKQQS